MSEAVHEPTVQPLATAADESARNVDSATSPAGTGQAASIQQAPGEKKSSNEGIEPPASWATWWLTDRDLVVFTLIAVVLLVVLFVRWAELSGWGTREIEIERLTPLPYNYRLDPNTASWVELAQLDGVGETLALRIVEDRETNGPFQSLEDLDRVKGIGIRTLERLRPYLHIAAPHDPE